MTNQSNKQAGSENKFTGVELAIGLVQAVGLLIISQIFLFVFTLGLMEKIK